jgi:hypothetical protein
VVEKTNSENATLTPSRPSMSGPAKTTGKSRGQSFSYGSVY